MAASEVGRENRDILGGAQREVPVLEEEIGRRIRKAKLVNVLLLQCERSLNQK